MREEMASLAQDMVRSYEDRVSALDQLKADEASLLSSFREGHAAIASRLKADLARVAPALQREEAQRSSSVRVLLKGIHDSYADLALSVRASLKGLHAEHAGAQAEWGKLAAAMQARRAAPSSVEAAAKESGPELGALRDSVFNHLVNHPDGTRLAALEQEFRLSRLKIARVVRSLMGENKIVKQGLLYFAA